MLVIFFMSANTADDSQGQSDLVLDMLHSIGLAKGVTDSAVPFFWIISIRKIAHMLEYFALAFSMNIAVYNVREFSNIRTAIISMVISYLYSCTDEIHQIFVPGRAGMVQDTLIDLMGIAVAILLLTIIRGIVIKKKEKSQ